MASNEVIQRLLRRMWESACKDAPERPSCRIEDGAFVLTITGNRDNWANLVQLNGVPADAEQLVDGDTLRVIVDLGFGIKTRQYLRLCGLNCPEMDSAEGKKAAEFVRNKIKVADQIILTSSKSDKYDRYLADVFYVDKEEKEVYLNNTLLESGLAVRVQS